MTKGDYLLDISCIVSESYCGLNLPCSPFCLYPKLTIRMSMKQAGGLCAAVGPVSVVVGLVLYMCTAQEGPLCAMQVQPSCMNA